MGVFRRMSKTDCDRFMRGIDMAINQRVDYKSPFSINGNHNCELFITHIAYLREQVISLEKNRSDIISLDRSDGIYSDKWVRLHNRLKQISVEFFTKLNNEEATVYKNHNLEESKKRRPTELEAYKTRLRTIDDMLRRTNNVSALDYIKKWDTTREIIIKQNTATDTLNGISKNLGMRN